MAKFSFAMTDKQVVDGITDIGKRATSVRDDMHKVAVSILHNWAKSGAVNVAASRATTLLSEADDAHAQKIVNWFAVHAGFTYNAKDELFVYDAKTTLTAAEFQAAKKETMFELTPDKKPQPAVDLRAMLQRVIMTAKKRRVEGVRDEDKVPEDLIKAVEALITTD